MKQLLTRKYFVYQLEHANQFVITSGSKKIFQSYESVCAIYDTEECTLTLGRNWDYSNTTLRHLYLFIDRVCNTYALGLPYHPKKKDIQKAINKGAIAYDEDLR